ncbi:hypothetical protein JRI60_28440 [Archangium violaceum]|uniref:hypothetical protein n=1 Tax=Archangium violaceum TaxID=83451 RepID=UPI0019514A2C|nr:hypothetical protein [Archangium violaceum]QRN93133.1 hypothetical protein JRI60_28440 [Archangium violaceum]
MRISAKKVYEVLKREGVEHIHHANSVITSCQFLRNGALLSRGSIEQKGLYQTPQNSDKIDKDMGVWFDVFADSVDIHHRASRLNAYGPVLFLIDIELLKKAYTGGIWITKLNPTRWEGKKHEDKWFTSVKEFENNFKKGEFNQMLVFRHCGGELSFKKYLKEIKLDDPNQKSKHTKIDYYSMAFGALKISMTEGGIDVPIFRRTCVGKCSCINEYSSDMARTDQMYMPKPIKSD